MRRSSKQLLAALVLLVACVACEEEPNLPPPPPPGHQATPAPGPGPASGETPADPAAAGEAPAEGSEEAPEEATPAQPDRVPTASEMLGLGRRSAANEEDSGALPPFLAQRPRLEGKSPLFTGRVVQPSSAYLRMPVDVSPVSPIERHWGADDELYGGRRNTDQGSGAIAAPVGDDGANPIFSGAPQHPEEQPQATERPGGGDTDERRFRLTMHRLDPRTGQIETVARSFTSRTSRDAALSSLRGQGYQANKPSRAEVEEARARIAERDKPAEQATPENACPFQAQWTNAGVRQSRCFQTQEQVDAFMAARAAQQSAAPSPAPPNQARARVVTPAAQPAGQPAQPAAPPPPRNDRGRTLQPVEIGQ